MIRTQMHVHLLQIFQRIFVHKIKLILIDHSPGSGLAKNDFTINCRMRRKHLHSTATDYIPYHFLKIMLGNCK